MDIPAGDLDLLAVGEALIDFISEEETDSLRTATTFRRYQGGSPANIAVNVAKLGGAAAVVSKTGIGAFGQFIKAELRRHGVKSDYLVMDHMVHTSVVFVSRTPGTPDFEAFRNGDYKLEPHEIKEEAIARARVVHVSTFALSREPCRSAIRRVLELARDHRKIISLDPNYSPRIWPEFVEAKVVLQELLGYATITKPSLDDAVRIFGPDQSPEKYIQHFHDLGPTTVVLTMGGRGILLSDNGTLTHIPARPIKIIDATGAGDCFWAGFLVALLDGNPLQRCVLFGREVVERKLVKMGPLSEDTDRREVYAAVDRAGAEGN
jgi:sugar/nucleoside kinase (ribokinase family)